MNTYVQQSIFDERHVLRDRYYQSLAAFDLNAACAALQALDATLSRTDDLQEKIAGLRVLGAAAAELASEGLPAYAAFLKSLDDFGDYRFPASDMRYVKRGVAKDIAERLPESAAEYIMPGLHPAEIFLEAGCPEKAMSSARQSIALKGEDPILRQIISFLCFGRGDTEGGFRYLGYALYNNPLCCKVQYLGHDDVRELMDTLLSASDNEAAAWLELPFALWKQNMLPVAGKEPGYDAYIRSLVEMHGAVLPCSDDESGLCFLRALYCAEALRLSKADHETMVALRSRMKALKPIWFKEYMLEIGRR